VAAELMEHGYAGASMERVAARAGIAKTTVYRRWGGLNGLLADLMAGYAAQEIAVPDEGDLGSDLRALAAAVVAALSDPAIGAAFASIVAAAVQDPAAREVLAEFITARAGTMGAIVHRAVLRGEIPAATDAAEVIQTVTAQLYYRLFIAGEPLSPAVADRAAAIAAAAARDGAFTAGGLCQYPERQPLPHRRRSGFHGDHAGTEGAHPPAGNQ
jgi:AcrR family transcriptional regulator